MKNLKILVPVDFSDQNREVLRAAEKMAQLFEGRITPFHAMLVPDENEYKEYQSLNISSEFRNYEKTMLERLDRFAGESTDPSLLETGIIKFGQPSKCILDASKEFDMIVMGSHGRTGFSRFFLGSIAEKVLRFSRIPVLIIHEKSNFLPLNKIMVTTDFSVASEEAFPWALRLSTVTGAEIELVYTVNLEQTTAVGFFDTDFQKSLVHEAEAMLNKFAKSHFGPVKDRVSCELLTSSRSPHHSLAAEAKAKGHNLVIMSTVGQSGFDYLMLGSTTAGLVRHTEAAVLVIHPPRTESNDSS